MLFSVTLPEYVDLHCLIQPTEPQERSVVGENFIRGRFQAINVPVRPVRPVQAEAGGLLNWCFEVSDNLPRHTLF
jgi:hypothetical protein